MRNAALVGTVLLLLVQPAGAFYWYGWPGSGVTPAPTIATRPATKLPADEGTPATVTPKVPEVPTEPKQIPEPVTLLTVAVGLATVGLARRWRRSRHPA